ncbi:MAG: penicillin-binding protein, partial [Deltaproteobacteria bacterium CG11_big_fil_rev_8_21_14_0_20_49_13]
MLQKFYKKHSLIGTVIRLIKFVTTFVIVFSTIFVGAIVALYFYFAYDLPNIHTLKDYKPPVVSEVFSDDGTKIGEFWKECRLWMPIEAIPKQVINGFIAAEDTRFFEHHGVDILGIGRAMFENLKAGHIVQGGSTITQQITRSILLSSERKIARKIREAVLATRIERNLNKEQILELYLNQIFLGDRAYGIKAAARNYFHKSVNELSIAEIAMIAGMPTAPSTDSPVHSIEKARDRQEYVLSKMYEHGFITKEQESAAMAERLTIHVAETDKDFNYKYTPYFTEHVRRMLIDKYGEKTLYEGGLKIYTTASLPFSLDAQKAVRWGLERLDKRQGYRGALGN